MSNSILRLQATLARIGVKKTKFLDDFVLHSDSDPFIPGTDIPRLRKVQLGERAVGFFDDEVDAVIEAFRDFRDHQVPSTPRPPLRSPARHRPVARSARTARAAQRSR
jgi:predicted DNA-binding transcriptional regulator AlpA